MALKPIFWTGAADIIEDYFVHNQRLQNISKVYPLYVVYSGRSDYLQTYYPQARLIPCENEWKAKIVQVQKAVENCQYDVIIRFCPDAIIKDVNWLLSRIESGIQGFPDTAVGNQAVFAGVTYLRGGCNATPGSIFNRLHLESSSRDYDTWYTLAIQSAGGRIRDWPLFEINDHYKGQMPVWHPTQYENGHRDMKIRLQTFLQEC